MLLEGLLILTALVFAADYEVFVLIMADPADVAIVVVRRVSDVAAARRRQAKYKCFTRASIPCKTP
jgi:hypothetical protein